MNNTWQVFWVSSANPEFICDEITINLKPNFRPKLALLFITESLFKHWKSFLESLKPKIMDATVIGFTIPAFFIKGKTYVNGVLIVLLNTEFKISFSNERTHYKSAKSLSIKTSNWNNDFLIVFSGFRIRSRMEGLRIWYTDKMLYSCYQKSDLSGKLEILEKYCNYIDEKKAWCETDKILEEFKENRKTVALNLFPMKTACGIPHIFVDESDVSEGIVAFSIENSKIVYEDVYPERGDSPEKTLEVLKNYFNIYEKVRVFGKRHVISEINKQKPADFIKNRFLSDIHEDINRIIKKLEGETRPLVQSTGLIFISRETFGVAGLPLESWCPVNFYPCVYDISTFYEDAWITVPFSKHNTKWIDILNKARRNSLKILFLDMNLLTIFRPSLQRLLLLLRDREDVVGILTGAPSAYIPNPERKYMTEIKKGICCSTIGSMAMLEIV